MCIQGKVTVEADPWTAKLKIVGLHNGGVLGMFGTFPPT